MAANTIAAADDCSTPHCTTRGKRRKRLPRRALGRRSRLGPMSLESNSTVEPDDSRDHGWVGDTRARAPLASGLIVQVPSHPVAGLHRAASPSSCCLLVELEPKTRAPGSRACGHNVQCRRQGRAPEADTCGGRTLPTGPRAKPAPQGRRRGVPRPARRSPAADRRRTADTKFGVPWSAAGPDSTGALPSFADHRPNLPARLQSPRKPSPPGEGAPRGTRLAASSPGRLPAATWCTGSDSVGHVGSRRCRMTSRSAVDRPSDRSCPGGTGDPARDATGL